MTTTWPHRLVAALPVRSFTDGKQRLRGVLATAQREVLIKHMVANVLQALAQSQVIAAWAVVSSDDQVLTWAEQRGALPIRQLQAGLNEAVTTAEQWAINAGADAFLVVLPDLPQLTAAAVRQLVQHSAPYTAVLAPDRHGMGTNALLLPLIKPFPWAFGPASFGRHRHLVQAVGWKLRVCTAPAWAFDLDTPDDLNQLPADHGVWAALNDVAPPGT